MDSSFLILDIWLKPAENIFYGIKKYEFRRFLPNEPFSMVFLYNSEKDGLIGCFEVDEIIKEAVPSLWDKYGTHATSKERFNKYFENVEIGFAIKLKNPIEYSKVYKTDALAQASTIFINEHYLKVTKNHKLYSFLHSVYEAEKQPLQH